MQETITIIIEQETLLRIMVLSFAGFLISMLLTPFYTTLAYKYQWWKKARTDTVTGEKASVYQSLHGEKHRRNIPTMAGVIFVASIALVTLSGNLIRTETWLPLAAMVGAGLIGLVDDVFNTRSTGGIAGMRAKIKLFLITMVASVGGWWFYDKLDVSSIHIPFVDSPLQLGILIIPLFVLVVVSTANAVNITDGLDGLAGGLVSIDFAMYALIAFLEGRYGVAGFCMTIVGALLSYTWFNIFPARFFMGDVGSFALGTALGVVAMLTDTVLILPIIGFVFVVEAGSSLLQILSKKLRKGRKIFRIAPIHHHFEALGWEETKVTMRFWVVGQVMGVLGLIVYIFGGKL
ncbi:phospho-N-acetylmuramoyl-pentapeptide-transferase [Candidatus Saccharibacteria bacterium]|nr:phospho-N-acetylmuramoyl-pentapeptide-transferase [Candidatus Saccharibacteria bacterium]